MSAPSAKRIVVANTIAYVVAVLVSFVQAPFLIHRLGDERYGLWSLIGLTTGYYGLLDFGVRGGVGYFVARAKAIDDRAGLAEVTASAFWFLAAIGGAVCVLGMLGSVFFPALFKVPAQYVDDSRRALMIAVATMALGFPLDVFSAIVNGFRRSEIISFAETLLRVAVMAAVFLIIPTHTRLDVLAGLNLASRAIVWVFSYVAARRLDAHWSLKLSAFRRSRMTEIFRYGLQTFVGNVAGTLVERFDTVVIAFALGPLLVTTYVVGQSLSNYLTGAVFAVTLALTPFFADLGAKSDKEKTHKLFFAGTRASSLITGIIAGGLFAFASAFLGLWVGQKYVQGSILTRSDVVLYVLLAALLPRLMLSAGHQYLYGTNQQGFMARIIVMEGITNLALSALLVKPYGLLGVALGSAIPSLYFNAWVALRYLARSLDVTPSSIFIDGQLRGIATGVALFCVSLVVLYAIPPVTWPLFFLDVALALLGTAPFMWKVGLTAADRQTVLNSVFRGRVSAEPA